MVKDFPEDQSEVSNEEDLDWRKRILATDPLLAAKLEKPQDFVANFKKDKKSPPSPSIRGRSLSSKAINPRKIKPAIPGRLKASYDDRLSPLEKLQNALTEKQSFLNQQSIYSSSKDYVPIYDSVASLLNLDESVVTRSPAELILLLQENLEEIEDSILKNVLEEFIRNLSANQLDYFAIVSQLFLPLPLPFLYSSVDKEFQEDEEETAHDVKESRSWNLQGTLENTVVSMSVETINFSKIHFLFSFNVAQKTARVNINGNSLAAELAIPIEGNIEDALFDDVYDIDFRTKLWRNGLIRTIEERKVKLKVYGIPNPQVLKITNSILQTIQESDIEIFYDQDDTSDYNII